MHADFAESSSLSSRPPQKQIREAHPSQRATNPVSRMPMVHCIWSFLADIRVANALQLFGNKNGLSAQVHQQRGRSSETAKGVRTPAGGMVSKSLRPACAGASLHPTACETQRWAASHKKRVVCSSGNWLSSAYLKCLQSDLCQTLKKGTSAQGASTFAALKDSISHAGIRRERGRVQAACTGWSQETPGPPGGWHWRVDRVHRSLCQALQRRCLLQRPWKGVGGRCISRASPVL